MYFQDINTSLEIWLIYDDTSVKSSRTEKRRIQDLRTVRGRKKQKTFITVKSIHLCKELIQCLFSFIIATKL